MPWLETDPMFERHHVAQDLASGLWTMTERCARYGISRNTGYQWCERFLALGVAGLAEHSCAPLSSPNETSVEIVAAVLAGHTRYGWGARKILKRLQMMHPTVEWPAQENGAHERMHRVLKAQATKPAAANANLQQRVFNTFRTTYNEVRPHEALDDETPASRWHPSSRPLPARITPPTYPGHFEVRRVSSAGTFRLHNGQQFLSQALNNELIGLEEIDDSVWNVLYYETLLGRFDERTRTITGAPSLKKGWWGSRDQAAW